MTNADDKKTKEAKEAWVNEINFEEPDEDYVDPLVKAYLPQADYVAVYN